MLKGKNIISHEDISKKDLEILFKLADDIMENASNYKNSCNGNILATLFYEPSTRTRLSFESAMHRLGGSVIGFSDSSSSSSTKGESIADTIKTVSCYSDLIVMRHNKEGAPVVASNNTSVPIINAGDGTHYHPTQTLTDLYTIYKYKKEMNNLTIGLCGDLKFGRTVHSLIQSISKYKNTNFIFISPDELKVPEYIKKIKNINYIETNNLEEVINDLDILYMTRVQKERFFNEEDYIKLKDNFILNKDNLKLAKESLTIMHPLPRNNEIHPEIDNDKRAGYFNQVKYGLYIRMALIYKILDKK